MCVAWITNTFRCLSYRTPDQAIQNQGGGLWTNHLFKGVSDNGRPLPIIREVNVTIQNRRMTGIFASLVILSLAMPAFAQTARRTSGKPIGRDARKLQACAVDKAKCCEAERKKYCKPGNRQDACLVDLIFKINKLTGTTNPLYDMNAAGIGAKRAPGLTAARSSQISAGTTLSGRYPKS